MAKNVVLLHTDQQRFDSLSINGNKSIETKNIDNLAKDGTNFTKHMVSNPTCMPSRASLLTGLYCPGHGVTSNGIPLFKRNGKDKVVDHRVSQKLFGINVEEKVPTLGDILSENGYETAIIGKLHLEPHLAHASYGFYESYDTWKKESTEFDTQPYYGFKHKQIILGHGEQPCGYNRGHYGRWLNRKDKDILKNLAPGDDANTSMPGKRDDIYLSKLPKKLHNTFWIADQAKAYINEHKEDPFFMFVGFPDPHHPFTPPKEAMDEMGDIKVPEFAAKEDVRGITTARKKAMDLRAATHEDCTNAYKNTMVSIKMIDEAVGEIIHTLKANNLYEDTIIIFTSDHGDYLGDLNMLAKSDLPYYNLCRVPLIFKGLENEGGRVINTPNSNVDVVPTILDMLDIRKKDYIQGSHLFSKEEKKPMITCFGITCDERNISIVEKNYKYTYYLDSKEEELYDIDRDEKELVNLASGDDEEIMELCKRLKSELLYRHVNSEIGIFNHYGMW